MLQTCLKFEPTGVYQLCGHVAVRLIVYGFHCQLIPLQCSSSNSRQSSAPRGFHAGCHNLVMGRLLFYAHDALLLGCCCVEAPDTSMIESCRIFVGKS